ncbi:MAG: zinc-ribbon domain-containing protein, partial [Streptosporangiaceae bacterium]
MKCPQCQAMNEQGSVFCGNCGTSLARPAPGPRPGDALPQSSIMSGYGSGEPGTP